MTYENPRETSNYKTRMSLHRSLETPKGLLENIIMKSCGIEYAHVFAIVKFDKNTNYEVILN